MRPQSDTGLSLRVPGRMLFTILVGFAFFSHLVQALGPHWHKEEGKAEVMAVFGRYGFFQIVVSFFPLSFGGFVQADEGVDETVGDEMELFGLQVVLHGTFLISQLEEGMSFHQVGIGKLVIGHRGIVACFDCFVEHLLVKVATASPNQ